MRVAGFDPGRDGAVVVLEGEVCLYQRLTAEICPLGYLPEAMVGVVADVKRLGVDLAVLETPFTRPGSSISVGLKIGQGWGLWRGILAGAGIPVLEVTPQEWIRAVLPDFSGKGKARSIARAQQLQRLKLSPGRRKVPHDGLADAACLALYGEKNAHGIAEGIESLSGE